MKTLRLCAVAMLIAAGMISTAHAGNVAELSGGVGCPLFTGGLQQLAPRLTAKGFKVSVGCSFDVSGIKRGDNVYLIGHSMGAVHAARAAEELKARGIRAKVIALDPLYTRATCPAGVDCICFYQGGFPMPGARNFKIPTNVGHIGFPGDPAVQSRILATVR